MDNSECGCSRDVFERHAEEGGRGVLDRGALVGVLHIGLGQGKLLDIASWVRVRHGGHGEWGNRGTKRGGYSRWTGAIRLVLGIVHGVPAAKGDGGRRREGANEGELSSLFGSLFYALFFSVRISRAKARPCVDQSFDWLEPSVADEPAHAAEYNPETSVEL